MIEYLPWSKAVLDDSLNEYRKGRLSVLDIELGGECNFACVYCDSPDRKLTCKISISTIERFLQSYQFKWIYICGIGEPTYANNYSLLIRILKLCEIYGTKCSIFSNIFNLTDELIDFVRKEILFILFKIDTQDSTSATKLYGINESSASHQIENIKKLTDLVNIKNGCTNLAASLVPTNINSHVIVKLIKEMCNIGIFPMIGDLEKSGRGRENFEYLSLSKEKLSHLEHDINRIVGIDYTVPQCPAVISSIHINSNNQIIVDEFSGLSCNWFWLEEPKLKTLAVLSEKTSLEEVTYILMQYRNKKVSAIKTWLDSFKDNSTTFGGCGGDISALLKTYLSVQECEN